MTNAQPPFNGVWGVQYSEGVYTDNGQAQVEAGACSGGGVQQNGCTGTTTSLKSAAVPSVSAPAVGDPPADATASGRAELGELTMDVSVSASSDASKNYTSGGIEAAKLYWFDTLKGACS